MQNKVNLDEVVAAEKNDHEKRTRLLQRWESLKSDRSGFETQWQQCSKFFLPRTGRFFVSDRNQGRNRHNNIYDNSPTRAVDVLVAGMMSGATSPARPWFKLETPDADLNKFMPVKMWLEEVTKLMMMIFHRSNTYRALQQTYQELAVYGTHATLLLPDFDNVIHNYSLTAGQYCIATDYKENVNTLYREFQKTVFETVNEFGIDNVSNNVLHLYRSGEMETKVQIIHAIEPRSARDPSLLGANNKEYLSNYFEYASDDDKFLRVSGFDSFKVMAPRWATSGGDTYGDSPGMNALGDNKQLQHEQVRKGQAIDYKVDPPIQVPISMKSRDIDRLPGGVTYTDSQGNQPGITSLYQVNLDTNELREDILDVRSRINAAMYADLFLMLANATDTRMTATEVAQRQEDKLVMLGPVMDRLHTERLEPLIDITFETMANAGILPEPPQELEGMKLNVVFVSILAQAQKAINTNSMDRFMNNVMGVSEVFPQVTDKVDIDAWVDEQGDTLGIPPQIVVPDDQAAEKRIAREQLAAEQAKLESLKQGAEIAKDATQAGLTEQG